MTMRKIKEKKLKERKTIDDEKVHYELLCQLGVLDDMEDWELYKKQEDIFLENVKEMSAEEYFRHMGKEYVPNPVSLIKLRPRRKNLLISDSSINQDF